MSDAPSFYDLVWSRYGDSGKYVDGLIARMRLHKKKWARLAERAGYDANSVRRWKNKKVKPTLETMLRLDEAFEMLCKGE